MDEFPEVPDVIEDGDTCEANAIKKATSVSQATGLLAVADDTGLEVDALGVDPVSLRHAMPVNMRRMKTIGRKLLGRAHRGPARPADSPVCDGGRRGTVSGRGAGHDRSA